MVSKKHLLDKNFNKQNSYFVNKDDDTKHLIDVDKSISTEDKYSEQLGRLISVFNDFGKTPKEFAELTRDMPIGWTKMSHATIYNIMNGKIRFNAMQLQEFGRIMRISVMDILEEPETVIKTEIVFSFNFEKGFCDPIPFNKPRQAVYFSNMKKTDPGMRAIVFRTENLLRNDTNVCLFNDQKSNIFKKQHGRDWLIYKYTLLKCANDDKYYLGKPLEWTDTDYQDPKKTKFTVKWQWFKGMKKEKNGMWVENYELMDCLFSEMYPVEVWDISLRKDDVIMDLL
tara:strand:- start:233 stop:1084 length:852 start_codon:yes stop_codon:yes gene_type:complete